jgi:5,10-methenyltetrahydromethanopterin hydrogenase
MRQIIKNIIFQGLIFFLVAQTINLSINSLDFYTPLKVINSFNDDDFVDSMVEFIVENVMGYPKNTFNDKANVNNTSKQQQSIAHFDLKWIPKSLIITDFSEAVNEISQVVPKDEQIVNLYFKEVPAKPPQFLFI